MTDLAFLTFDQLLEQYFARPGVEAELARRYGTTAAVLVVDFTGMVERTDAHGIGYALALAAAAQRAMLPVLAGHGGALVKQVADTAFVVFEDPARALLAALDGHRALETFHAQRGGHDHVRACMGLGYGEALVVPGRDLFGPEVNRAFVLGEDVARGGETLVTDALLRAVGALPAGIGAFRGPSDREQAAGCPFHVVADYR